jgi:hypothetical protein
MICQSKEWESIETHWWGNHSVRCLKPDKCDLCEKRNDVAWKAYLLGTSPTGDVTAIFQLTPLSAYMLEEQITRDTGLLGAIIKLNRVGKRKNGPLEASIRGYVKPVVEKPYEQLHRVVNVLYRQYSDLQESGG